MRKLMSAEGVAEHLSVSVKTLENWRARKKGPPFIRVGSLVRYDRAAVMAWQDGQTVYAEKEGE